LGPIGFEIAMVMRAEDLHGLVRGEAFRHLLAAGVPATGEDLAASIGLSADKVAQVLEELSTSGGIRRDETGRVIRSAGLSVVADRHQIDLEGRRFSTWCAYDIIGIFGALRATGSAVSRSPVTGATVPRRPVSRCSGPLIQSAESLYERLRGVVPEKQLLRRRWVGTRLVRESQTRGRVLSCL
jgi:hypothetical protein